MPIEAGEPSADPRLFRRCLGQYATGIAVVTAQSRGQLLGMTINSFASLSLDPALVLWSIDKKSSIFDAFLACEGFAINVLSTEQIALSQRFAGKSDERYSGVSWRAGLHQSPLLTGCIAHLECTLEKTTEGGDHIILVGRVERIARFEGSPLLFSQGQYSIANTHPDVSVEPESVGDGPVPEFNLLSTIFDAHHALSEAFEEHRRAEGVSVSVARVLATLYDKPGIGVESLAKATYLGRLELDDALRELDSKEMLVRESDGSFRLNDRGERQRLSVRDRWHDFQRAQLAGASEKELKLTLLTLQRLLDSTTLTSVAEA